MLRSLLHHCRAAIASLSFFEACPCSKHSTVKLIFSVGQYRMHPRTIITVRSIPCMLCSTQTSRTWLEIPGIAMQLHCWRSFPANQRMLHSLLNIRFFSSIDHALSPGPGTLQHQQPWWGQKFRTRVYISSPKFLTSQFIMMLKLHSHCNQWRSQKFLFLMTIRNFWHFHCYSFSPMSQTLYRIFYIAESGPLGAISRGRNAIIIGDEVIIPLIKRQLTRELANLEDSSWTTVTILNIRTRKTMQYLFKHSLLTFTTECYMYICILLICIRQKLQWTVMFSCSQNQNVISQMCF